MSGRTRAAENNYLNHVLNNAAWANIGDTGGLQPSTADGNLYVSLHTADPTDSGHQQSNEATFQNYARVAVARTGAAWTVANGQASNAGAISQVTPAGATGTPQTVTHVGIGTDSTGTGNLIWSGLLTPSRTVDNGDTVEFAAGALVIDATTLEG